MELSAGFDSLSVEQKTWVHKTKVGLARNYFTTGILMNEGIAAMQNAPVPEQIKGKPLYYYQYLKQLLETLEPMKLQTRNYFLWAYKQLDSLKLLGENSKKCLDKCAIVNFSLGADYDKLSEQILRAPDIPKDLTAAEREDLSFQLEDIVFELQDKAIYNYEDALRALKKDTAIGNAYSGKILQALARLNPDKYGKNFYKRVVFVSGKDWDCRADSVKGWAAGTGQEEGWKSAEARALPNLAVFPFGPPAYVWGDSESVSLYLKKHIYFDGLPRDAAIHFAFEGKYWLYVNGVLTSSDTTGERLPDKRDSISGITKLFKGGDNEIAAHVQSMEPLLRGAAIAVSLLIDTTQHFAPDKRFVRKDTEGSQAGGEAGIDTSKAESPAQPLAATPAEKRDIPYDHVFKSRKEVAQAIADYTQRAQNAEREIKKERLEIQRLHLKNDDFDSQIRRVKEEIAELKKKMPAVTPKQNR